MKTALKILDIFEKCLKDKHYVEIEYTGSTKQVVIPEFFSNVDPKDQLQFFYELGKSGVEYQYIDIDYSLWSLIIQL